MVLTYEDWNKAEFECSNCLWIGIGNELVSGNIYKKMFEMNCPDCNQWLIVNSYSLQEDLPSDQSARTAINSLTGSQDTDPEASKPDHSATDEGELEYKPPLLRRILTAAAANLSAVFLQWTRQRLYNHTSNICVPFNKRWIFEITNKEK
ncbi:MAG: hypothetical protein OXU66_12605 [Gammaproteobacteria bacterium]|nr:hypothetical protein [Gammaproteobacteria bacterium]MDD9959761.1 hypothetical protein [Gammaproteobacteria bacterium]